MSGLPNPVQALLRNTALLKGRVALIGLSSPALVDQLPGTGPLTVFCEHAGVFETLQTKPGCDPVFGYSSSQAATADTVVVFMPKAKSALEMQLALAASLLAPGGRILLLGEKKEGIAGGSRALTALAPDAAKQDSARHCQVWMAHPSHTGNTFNQEQWLTWHRIEAGGTAVDVAGLPGIFSDGRLDDGTALLLETLTEAPAGPLLDFACGAGVIGAWLQRRFPGLGSVDAVDVQAQAVLCAQRTYERNGAEGKVMASDGLPDSLGRYQTILTNPPFHIGVRTDTSITQGFLASIRQHLLPGGELRLVANRFLPYQSWLHDKVGPVGILAENPRFVVYQVRRT